MSKIGIFYGSDTGNTEKIAHMISNILGKKRSDIYNISESYKKDIEKYDKILLGISTWYYGEAQCDWDDFFPIIKKINFKNKICSIFGCGDQKNYPEYFCDAMGILGNIIKLRGANIVGNWSTKGYSFTHSKCLVKNKYFIGLAIDEDTQPELTYSRIKIWINQINKEMNIY
ncbi:MAG: flavodoxin FldA [Candidatus Makana argininalis]